ncbi:MAG: hypothetical protein B7W98_00485 [Parcubacteria group bacterium 20-58-5]|nr:MAG: hypothetical protein B7W98_00485 [Parcubacteria group bacterium 20-58-5]OYV63418.1 MAG: hypothetical protein B7X03_01910 [Parcubacteria group bacterium 21-58-10]OYV83173.1 MAG: hypothetical protein B7W96_00465 [Parcubacteria group bacterium 37-58-5]HQT82536.1 type II secretion system protein [Candidatus Paceibacterota bacterium]
MNNIRRTVPNQKRRGYTLVELVVAVGLFALVMTLASGAYLLMISINRQAQGIATGINNLSFALETVTRTIRTGRNYPCNTVTSCTIDAATGGSFSFTDENDNTVTYSLGTTAASKQYIEVTTYSAANGTVIAALTDPQSVDVTGLTFYVSGTKPGDIYQDIYQPHVTIIVQGNVSVGPGKPPQPFSIETGATMRGTDL